MTTPRADIQLQDLPVLSASPVLTDEVMVYIPALGETRRMRLSFMPFAPSSGTALVGILSGLPPGQRLPYSALDGVPEGGGTGAPFDLHEDVGNALNALDDSDHILVSAETLTGEPNRYVLAITLKSFIQAGLVNGVSRLNDTTVRFTFAGGPQVDIDAATSGHGHNQYLLDSTYQAEKSALENRLATVEGDIPVVGYSDAAPTAENHTEPLIWSGGRLYIRLADGSYSIVPIGSPASGLDRAGVLALMAAAVDGNTETGITVTFENEKYNFVVGGSPPATHTRRIAISADASLSEAEALAGGTSETNDLIVPAYAGVRRYIFIGIPESAGTITGFSTGSLDVTRAFERAADVVVSGTNYRWWRTRGDQSDLAAGRDYMITITPGA